MVVKDIMVIEALPLSEKAGGYIYGMENFRQSFRFNLSNAKIGSHQNFFLQVKCGSTPYGVYLISF